MNEWNPTCAAAKAVCRQNCAAMYLQTGPWARIGAQ